MLFKRVFNRTFDVVFDYPSIQIPCYKLLKFVRNATGHNESIFVQGNTSNTPALLTLFNY